MHLGQACLVHTEKTIYLAGLWSVRISVSFGCVFASLYCLIVIALFCWLWLYDLLYVFKENCIPQINKGKEGQGLLWLCLTDCVPICVLVCECAYVVFLLMWVNIKGETIVPLMPCVVRSEMDGRCSTWELLFSHTISLSLHSHPSSLPRCVPLPTASSGAANQSHGHWVLLPTAHKKNLLHWQGLFFVQRERKKEKR